MGQAGRVFKKSNEHVCRSRSAQVGIVEQQYRQPRILMLLLPLPLSLSYTHTPLETDMLDGIYNDIIAKLAKYLSPFQSSIQGHRLLIEWDELDVSIGNSGDVQGPVHKVKNLAKKNRDIQAELNMMQRKGMTVTRSLSMNTKSGFCQYVKC